MILSITGEDVFPKRSDTRDSYVTGGVKFILDTGLKLKKANLSV